MKRALIIGVSGQDGAYLSKLLLTKKYQVWGTSRDIQRADFTKLSKLNVLNQIKLLTLSCDDLSSFLKAIEISTPDEVYYLAGQSSVGLSFEKPAESIQSIVMGTLNLLEACKTVNKEIKIYFAGSSECFGNTGKVKATERTAFKPKSPYAVAKVSSYWLVNNYRESYNIKACTGLLFNHESPLRPERFVTQKIISAAKRISKGSNEILELGNLDISRDWGWASEYVEAMWLMLQQVKFKDYVISTGETNSLKEFVSEAFLFFGLDWRKHVKVNDKYLRPTDIIYNGGNSNKAKTELGWNPKIRMRDVISMMIENKY
jgi:GDPmannose 4,6-dehydratase